MSRRAMLLFQRFQSRGELLFEGWLLSLRMPGATRERNICPASVCPAIQATRTCPGTIRRTQLGMLEQETTYLHSLGDACQMTSAVVLT